MNSIHRVGLVIAGLVAVLTVGGALAVQNFVAGASQTAASAASSTPPTAAPTEVQTDAPSLDPQVIYVEPADTPATVTVTLTPAPRIRVGRKVPPPVIHVTVTPSPGDDGGEGDD